MAFFWAWVASSETTFNASHERYDENVFAFTIEHREGECATLSLTIRNPRVGLLSIGRPVWGWLSWSGPDTSTAITPLFFGRLVGIPEMQGSASGFAETVTLTFIAKPIDFAAQRRALAEALAVLPDYDPIFIDENLRIDPLLGTGDVNTALEARSARWQCSRGEDGLPLVVSYSDICIGEDGTEVFESMTGAPACIDPASVNLTISGTPLDSVTVKATVPWKQDMTDAPAIDLGSWSIPSYTGEALVSSWPKQGASISGGWAAAQSSAVDVYNADGATTSNFSTSWHNASKTHTTGDSMSLSVNRTDVVVHGPYLSVQLTRNSQPGVVWVPGDWGHAAGDGTLPTIDTTNWGPETSTTDTEAADTINIPLHHASTWAVVPQSLVNLSLSITFDAGADRNETCNFTMVSDVQPVLTDPADFDTSSQANPPDEAILEINGADPTTCLPDGTSVSAPIDASMSSYFHTARGQLSIEYLLLRARALLLAGARIVTVNWGIPFDRAILLTCRKNATLIWEKLPGGYASGKVVQYTISAGEGKLQGSVTIAATVGRNDVTGTGYTAVAGVGELVVPAEDALEPGIQQMIGQVIPVAGGDVAFSPPLMSLDTAGDPMPFTKDDVVISEQIVGSAAAQGEAILAALALASSAAANNAQNASTIAGQLVTQAIRDLPVYLQIELRGTNDLKFADTVIPTLEPLLVPRTINLEDAVTT